MKIIIAAILIMQVGLSKSASKSTADLKIQQASHRLFAGGPAGNSILHSYEIIFVINKKKSIVLDSLFCPEGTAFLKPSNVAIGINFDTVGVIVWLKEKIKLENESNSIVSYSKFNYTFSYYQSKNKKNKKIIFKEVSTNIIP